MDLGWVTLGIALARRLGGSDVRYRTSRFHAGPITSMLRRCAIRPVDLDELADVPLGQRSMDAPYYALEKVLDAADVATVATAQAGSIDSKAVRVALAKTCLPDGLGLFLAQAWLLGRSYAAAEILVRDDVEAAVMGELVADCRVRTVRQPAARAPGRFTRRGQQPAGRVPTAPPPDPARAHPGPTPDGIAEAGPTEADVIVVFNRGDRYGALFTYEHLFSPDPGSPLSRRRAAVMSAAGGILSDGTRAAAYPTGGSRLRRLQRARSIRKAAGPWARTRLQRTVARRLGTLLAQAEGAAAQLRRDYPRASVANLAFEIQVPAYLTLAFAAAGMRTVALHERPETAFERASPMIADTLLTASPFFSEAVASSWSAATSRRIPVGMWRTDLLHGLPRGRELILALPYHVGAPDRSAIDTITTGIASLVAFLSDILELAALLPGEQFVIRSKQVDWLVNPVFRSVIDRIDGCANVAVSTDYSDPIQSYRLCSRARLIIGKPTSLIDEALAKRIPAILHDFTPNSRASRMRILEYLPRDLWALDGEELVRRVDWALARDGEQFLEWWEPHRQRIYGDLNDGHVRERGRRAVLDSIATSRDDS